MVSELAEVFLPPVFPTSGSTRKTLVKAKLLAGEQKATKKTFSRALFCAEAGEDPEHGPAHDLVAQRAGGQEELPFG